MKKLRRYGLTVVTVGSVVTVVLLVTGWGTAAAAQITSVFVTNNAANPVPVRQQGTANVNVTNATVPVHEQGNEEVSVSHIFTNSNQFVSPVCEGTLYTVPAGKQLVVEWVAGMGQGTNVQPAGSLPSGQINNIPIVWESGYGVSASQAVHFTFPAGTDLNFQAGWNASTGCNLFMSLGGHLEPMP